MKEIEANTPSCPKCGGKSRESALVGGKVQYQCKNCRHLWYEQPRFLMPRMTENTEQSEQPEQTQDTSAL
jgi:tRNA(Ile2) C34 agmatinyltransferase TiaS